MRKLLFVSLILALSFSLYAWRGFYSLEPSTMEISRADSLTGFDVQKYTVNLQIDDISRHLEGWVEAIVLAEDDLSQIQYRLEGGDLAVSEVQVNGNPSPFDHSDGIITIPVQISAGNQFTTKVTYSGYPGNSPAPYNIGLKFTTNGCYTLSNPDAGRYYMPTYDHPWDKALVEWYITVREDWLAAANGIRESITDNGDGTKTHHWVSQYPVATYVMGFAAAPYVEFLQNAGAIPIQNFVLPGQLANAEVDFANVPEMIAYFSQLFGPYPFEKYGHMVVNMSTYAAMEHQTMTTFGAQYLDGQQGYESIVAHELAHQWYGNFLTPITMREVWLKESFATYSEALWVHHKEGWQAATEYLKQSIQDYYISWENSNGPRTIFNPEYNMMFAPPTYEKSASVLHMLRLKMGNDAFFPFIRSLLTTYPNGNLNTAEFITLAETASGMDLTQFFQQWIFSPGIPNVEVMAFRKDDDKTKIYAKSLSPTPTEFHIDIPLVFPGAIDSLVVMASPVWEANTFTNMVAAQMDTMQIDPNNWVLMRQKTEVRMQLTNCLPYDGAVKLAWLPIDNGIPVVGYHVWRRNGSEYSRISENIITALEYTDLSVLNGFTYDYYVCAVDSEGYISLPSNLMSASPIDFAFDEGFLVVAETRNGNGSAISPTSMQVDEFYANALDGFDFTVWNYSESGAPDLAKLSHHPLVLWHSDDFSEQLLIENLDTISSYIISGGKILISGWKYPSVFSAPFKNQFLADITPTYYNSAVLISLNSSQYPALIPDPAKLMSAWNNMLPMSYTFVGAENPIYTATMTENSGGNNQAAAIKIDEGGSLVLLGFPLFFMQAEGAKGFLQQIIPELYPEIIPIDPNTLPVSLDVFPNPITLGTQIKMNNATLNSVKIYNLRGQEVFEISGLSSATYLIPPAIMAKLPSACYIVKATGNRGSIVKKMLKY